jgi:hypothetical protein
VKGNPDCRMCGGEGLPYYVTGTDPTAECTTEDYQTLIDRLTVTAPQPDTRTPGRVLEQAWEEMLLTSPSGTVSDAVMVAALEQVAAAVLAHADAQRAARGEVVVPRMHVETLISVAEEFNPRLTSQTRSELQAALAVSSDDNP